MIMIIFGLPQLFDNLTFPDRCMFFGVLIVNIFISLLVN